jgi:hypothetical protein
MVPSWKQISLGSNSLDEAACLPEVQSSVRDAKWAERPDARAYFHSSALLNSRAKSGSFYPSRSASFRGSAQGPRSDFQLSCCWQLAFTCAATSRRSRPRPFLARRVCGVWVFLSPSARGLT